MAYDGWELGFESSRSGAGRKAWSRTVNFNESSVEKIDEQNKVVRKFDEREWGFESSRCFSPVTERTTDSEPSAVSANKKLSHCLLSKQQIVLLDSDMIVWDK